MEEQNTLATILKALHFAADKHRDQRRKDEEASPYINHPIEVAELLARVGGVQDLVILQGAILHDTIEDTNTTPEELEAAFGRDVRRVVEEVTDDTRLPKAERKRLQIEHAPHLSDRAKHVKLADKIANVRSVTEAPPAKGRSLVERNTWIGPSRSSPVCEDAILHWKACMPRCSRKAEEHSIGLKRNRMVSIRLKDPPSRFDWASLHSA